jgi:hypothetical protein
VPSDDLRDDDARLEQVLHDAAPAVSTTGVVANVTRRRSRRVRNRRVAAGALSLVALLAVAAVTVLVTRDDGSSPHVASPSAHLGARIVTGDGAVDHGAGTLVTPAPVRLDADAKNLRGPMLVGANALSIASYDAGPDGVVAGVAASHVVRVDGTHVVDTTDFKARIVSLAEGEGARWALTQNEQRTGGQVPDAFLKRIPASGAPVSTPLPLDSEPVGPIAATGGAVWVPVRDGVLQYDPSGTFVRKVPLPDADQRCVAQVGKFAYATDGNVLRSLDTTGRASSSITFGPEIMGLASVGAEGRVLLADERGAAEHARVALADSTAPVHVVAVAPTGFVATGLAASTTRFWITGTVDGAPAIALLGDDGVPATIVLENAGPSVALAWTGAHTVRAVSGGTLYDITVP